MTLNFNDAVEQYTTYLLKLSYLIVGNKHFAEDIVQEVFINFYDQFGDHPQLDNTKSYLVKMTMNGCHKYLTSWRYRITKLKGIISKEAHQEPSQVGQAELLYTISKLPVNYREVILLYYFGEQTTIEMAKTLNCPISTVNARLQRAHQRLDRTLHAKLIDDALGNWDTESAQVKQEIIRVSIQKQVSKSKKRVKWKILATIVALLVLMLGGFLMWQGDDEANVPILPTEPIIPVVENEHVEIIPHEKTLQLYKYEAFYYSSAFYTETQAELVALERVMGIYPTLYHMDKFHYAFPKDREEHYRNRAAAVFNSRMKEPDFKQYFEFIQQKHGISEQDYIEYTFFLEEKYNYMQNLRDTKYIGYVDGEYPSLEVNKEYEAILGITVDDLHEKIKKEFNSNLNQNDEVENAPLTRYNDYFNSNTKFVYNEKGEVIIIPTDLTYLEYDVGYFDVYDWIMSALKSVLFDYIFTYESGLAQQLYTINNRVNLPEFITLLEQFEGTAEQESIAQEAIAFIRIFENSIDMVAEREFILPR